MNAIILYGAGTEGRAAAQHFSHHRQPFSVYDDDHVGLGGGRSIDRAGCEAMLPGSIFLRSPGIPPTAPLVALALEKAQQVTTPTGYWFENFAPSGTVSITGTKGKSTTTALTALLLQAGGLTSSAYGNIGTPPLNHPLPCEDHPVVELSSYMMHDLPQADHFHLVTNLYKEHTDWHGSEPAYREAKLRPFRLAIPRQGFAPRALIDQEHLPNRVQAIEDASTLAGDHLKVGKGKIDLGPEDNAFRTPSMGRSLQAAVALGSLFLSPERLTEAAQSAVLAWQGLPCRQQIVTSQDGRLWVDDALATIPEATLEAIERFRTRNVLLILGGGDRGQDFRALVTAIEERSSLSAVCFGPVADRLPFEKTPSFQAAIARANALCPPGGVILFSPAAPSSPPYRSYKERSEVFARSAAEAR